MTTQDGHIDNPETGKTTSRKRQYQRFMAFLVIALLIAGALYYHHNRYYESTDDAAIDGHFSLVSARVSGYVKTVYVTDNQWVKAGDPIVDLDPADYKARLDAALAALDAARSSEKARNYDVKVTTLTAESNLKEAKASVSTADSAVESAKAQLALARSAMAQADAEVKAAEAKHHRDTLDLKRYQDMAATQAVSPQSLEHMETAERMSAAALTAAKKAVETKNAMIRQAEAALEAARSGQRQADARLSSAGSAPDRINQSRSHADMASADLKKAEADVEQARLNLSYTNITSPSDGYVTRKKVENGVLIQAGQSILSVVPKEVWVTANFKETQITRMKPGQPVNIRVDTFPNVTFKCRVDSIQRGTGALFSLLPPENATGNFVKVVQRVPVKIVFEPGQIKPDMFLSPGMSVVAVVDTAK